MSNKAGTTQSIPQPFDGASDNAKSRAKRQDAESIEKMWRDACADSFDTFANGLLIDGRSGPKAFGLCMAEFQKEAFADISQSLVQLRNGEMPECQRFWWERTKKAGKDSDIALMLLWLLAFPKRPFYGQIGAADRDQAAIIKRRIVTLIRHNPWLDDLVEVVQYKLRSKNKLAEIDIMAADIQGAHGETPDILVVNELTHVNKWEFIENLMDNADGVPNGVVIVATNAGFMGTAAEKLRRVALTSDLWRFRALTRPAPWHSPKFIDDARKRAKTPARFRRLWEGVWASGKGDAFRQADLDRMFNSGAKELSAPEPGWVYLGGLDLGVKHDHSGFVIVGIHQESQRIKLVRFWAWEPSPISGEVDLRHVEKTILRANKTFRLEWLGFDPTEARLMAQRLSGVVPMVEVNFGSPKNLTAMAECAVQVVSNGTLECYDDESGRIRRDFGKFHVVEKPYGYKLEATSDEYGHADVGTALMITLPTAVDLLGGGGIIMPDDELTNADVDDDELDDEEFREELPDELADIYDAEDEWEDEVGGGYDDPEW